MCSHSEAMASCKNPTAKLVMNDTLSATLYRLKDIFFFR